ncbi:hypothetical protein [Lactovum odontotermitis]
MKKILSLVVIFLSIFALTACSNQAGKDKKRQSTDYTSKALYISSEIADTIPKARLIDFKTLRELPVPRRLKEALTISVTFSDGSRIIAFTDGKNNFTSKLFDKDLKLLDHKLKTVKTDSLAGFYYSAKTKNYYGPLQKIIVPEKTVDKVVSREKADKKVIEFLSNNYYASYSAEESTDQYVVKEVKSGKTVTTLTLNTGTSLIANDDYFYTVEASPLAETSDSKAMPSVIKAYGWNAPTTPIYQSQPIDGTFTGTGLFGQTLVLDDRQLTSDKGIKTVDLKTGKITIIPASEEGYFATNIGNDIIVYDSWDIFHDEIKIYDYQGKVIKEGKIQLLKKEV